MLGAAETASAALECGGEAAIVAETKQPGAGTVARNPGRLRLRRGAAQSIALNAG